MKKQYIKKEVEMKSKEFKVILQAFLDDTGMTQKELATRMLCNDRSIRWWLSGKVKPSRMAMSRWNLVTSRRKNASKSLTNY